MTSPRTARWRRRPILAAGVRIATHILPLAAGVTTSTLLARALPPARHGWDLAGYWVVAFAISSAVLYLVHRGMQRLLPLALLLTMSLAFPHEAPSRLRVARGAMSTGKLRARVERARTHGVDDEPTRAAEQILSLVAAVEAHDRATRGHSERVRLYTDLLADEMGLTQHAKDRLRWAALLHDVGKLRVPGEVLNKPQALDEDEWVLVRGHPDEGARLIAPLREWLGEWARAVEEHHERYDGSGYPRALRGEGISLAGRMVAVTDAFETMTAARPYRKPRSAEAARKELVRCAGTDFDPVVVRAFLRISVGRLGLLSGPLSWLAQTPVLRGLEVAADAAGRAAAGAAAVGGTLALTMTPVVPVDEAPGPEPPATVAVRDTRPPETRPPAVGPIPEPSPTGPAPEPSPSPSPRPSPTGPTVGLDPSPSADPTPQPTPSRRTSINPQPKQDPVPEPSAGAGPGGIHITI